MPINNNVFSLPSGWQAVTGTVIQSGRYNDALSDIAAAINTNLLSAKENADGLSSLTAMFDGAALFDMPVVVKAATGGNANVWLKDETEKNQGVVYWDRNLDQVVIAAYSADGSTQDGQVRISTTEASWNGHEFWHENNAAIQTIQGVKGRKAFLKNNSGGTLVYGAEVDGSQLSYASISSAGTVVSSGVPPGRWACLGWAPVGSGCEYVRVS